MRVWYRSATELRALCDQFRELMARGIDEPLFERAAKERIAQLIGRAALVGSDTAVTSALLFGPLQDGVTPDRPYAAVDHYRVLDADTMKDDQQELYTVLERIQDVLESRPKYDFVNLSLGPDLPIEDNDVHAWTAVLDQLFADGQTLPAIAIGNSGELDWSSGNARIQTRPIASMPCQWVAATGWAPAGSVRPTARLGRGAAQAS